MILNLNDPSKIEDTSWIKPMKYVGFGGKCMLGNRLGILQVHKMLKTLDARIIAVRKNSDY
jgi:hypothetical protein